MADIRTFDLPDLGEGLTEGEILRWLVTTGETVTLNQPIVEVETAKAAVEIPSPFAGVVTVLHHEEGATVEVGSPLIAFDTAPGAAFPPSNTSGNSDADADRAPEPGVTASPGVDADAAGDAAMGGRTPVLVGYGPRTGGPARRRARRHAAPDSDNAPQLGSSGLTGDRAEPTPDETLPLLPTIPDALAAGAKPVRHGGLEMGRAAERAATAAGTVDALPTGTVRGAHPATTTRPRAKPPVRKLARDLGVDLATVPATGPDGTVSRDDVLNASAPARTARAGAVPTGGASATATGAGPTRTEPVGTGPRERRVPVRGVRKLTAEAMVASVATAPHVTEWLTVDVTRTLRAVRRLRENPAFADVRVNPMLLIAKAVTLAVARRPELNSSWVDGPDGAEIVVKEYVNLGIAAATPRGLLVPNIKDADRLPLPELAAALDELVGVAKAGRTPPADLAGGTITITNVGVFGVDAGTPILNPGEAAILCVGQIAERPWVHGGTVKPRSVCQLALSFDHRIVDGEGGSKFLADVGRFLEDPERTALAWS